MEKEKLKEYMGIVVDMEKSIYMMEQTRDALYRKMEWLGHETEIPCPSKHDVDYDKEAVDFFIKKAGEELGGAIIVPIIIGLFSVRVAIIVTVVFFLPLGLLLAYTEGFEPMKRVKKRLSENEEKYRIAMEEYEQKCEEERKRLEKENFEKRCLNQIVSDLFLQIYKSKEALDKIYEEDIIYVKYRNLAMMCYLYEYISSGRCDRLEGPDGGYNMLETDMRFDRISVQMDTVISQLNDIKANQSMIYSAMRDIQYQQAELISDATSRIMSGLKTVGDHISDSNEVLRELRDSSALTTYYSERTQKELSYMNRMDFLTGRNDDVFFNIPPT